MLTSTPLQRGFTLIEAMITTVILAVLLLLAVPVARDFLLNQRIRTAAETFQSGLQYARAEAAHRNSNVEFVHGTGSTWTVRLVSDGSTLKLRPSEEGTDGVVVTVLPGDATRVTFDGFGFPTRNADGSARLTRATIDLDPSVLSADRTRELRIDIDAAGESRLCDPNVTDPADSRYCS